MADRVVPESAKTPFFPALDGVRTLAIFLVFGVHFIPRLVPFGWMGVQLFFVLSGFLITGILFDTSRDKHRYRNFYARRALRIFPLYYGFLLLLAVITLLTHGHPVEKFWLWFCYLQNFFWILTPSNAGDGFVTGAGYAFAGVGHLWSLALEEQFYLMWPVLVFWVRDRRRLMQLCLVLIVLRIALAAFWQVHLSPDILNEALTYRMLPTQADAFLLGGLLALWWRGNPTARVERAAGLISATAVLCYALLLAALHRYPGLIGGQNIFDYRSAFQAVAGLPLCNLASALFLLGVLVPGTWAFRLCNKAALRSLGRVSYGLYVFHLPVFLITEQAPLNFFTYLPHGFKSAGHCLEAVLLTTLLAYASYFFYERPFLLLKNRFTSLKDTGKLNSPARTV